MHYPHYITVMRKRKAILWKRWKVSNAPEDKALYKTVAGNCKNAIDKFHSTKELALVRKNNLGSFFSFINNRLKSYVTSAGLKMDDGSITTDPSMKAEVFNKFFGSVFTADDGLRSDVKNRVVDDVLNTVTFTPNIVRGVLLKLKPSTSSGYDCIPNVFLKKCANTIATPLCHIFSVSFLDGCLPETWKYAIVTPVHKKGPTSDPNNFRPISLTATCCRVMERIVNDILLRYLLDRRLISKQQHGFIRRRSVCRAY